MCFQYAWKPSQSSGMGRSLTPYMRYQVLDSS